MSADDISSLKRDIKRISNKRAVVIATRLSGDQQDPNLKMFEREIIRAETELSRIRLLQSKGSTGKASSILVDNGGMMSLETLKHSLECIKSDLKEKVHIFVYTSITSIELIYLLTD